MLGLFNPKTEVGLQKETKGTKQEEVEAFVREIFLTALFRAKILYPSLALLASVISVSEFRFNPVLKTMNAWCAASRLPRVQREVGGHSFSRGSFCEAQHLIDSTLLEEVFGDLAGRVQGPPPADVRPA